MVFTSPFPSLDIPKTNLLTYLFPEDQLPQEDPLWLDCKDDRINLSPKELVEWVKRLSFGLERIGVKRGDVVLVCTPNQIFVPVAYLGIVGAGCIFSGANPAYTVSELVHQLNNTTAKVILAHPDHLDHVLAAAEKANLPKNRIFQFSDTEAATRHGIPDWRALLGTPSEVKTYRWPDLTPSESETTVATINYSSGTTGLPKGVCVSHHNLIANVEQTIVMRYAHKPYPFASRPAERWIGFLPLYHAYGQLYTILMAIRLRAPVYVMREFRYEDFLAAIGRYRITSLQNECQRRFGVQINQGWGMTEGREVGVGQPGEMVVRGPNVCLGYWRNEAATKECIDSEGWLKTGDIAVCDKKGFFWIVDRKKELIKVNALQVAPAELEAVLLENEHIADAAAVGITVNGEEKPRAYVAIQEDSKGRVTPGDVAEWIKTRVAKHKRLTGGVVFVEEVPKLASGKIQRKTMREWAKRDATAIEAASQQERARL
ncbi:hypothetical protein VdG1_03392 [Verticillium dahliae VDG1]|nr:hypothetical protein VdG1_03392 [Verticillium dahliae VDG1]